MTKKKTKGKSKTLQETIIEVCLKRGIVFPTAEIYGGSAGFFELGPVGEALRQNMIDLWRDTFIKSEDNVYEISGSTILPEKVFEASGHLDSFNDPLTQCQNCKSMYRVDHLILEQVGIKVEGQSLDDMWKVIQDNRIKCPNCKHDLSPPKQFNMMFSTNIGSTSGNIGYLRPETAQNIFLSFRRVSHSMRAKLPFGIAQIGRAYRNEISPRNFLVRLRELQQMELEMFVDPDLLNSHPRWDDFQDTEINFLSQEAQEKGDKATFITIKEGIDSGLIVNQYLGYFLAMETGFIESLGIKKGKFFFRHLLDHETAHYSKANYDLEIEFPFGVVECVGLAYRTDYDLRKHQEKSKTKLHISEDGKKIIPHVVEPSFGVDRLIYAILLASYREGDRDWTWFDFPNSLAPWEVVVAPLQRKDGLPEGARELFWELKDQGIDAIYDQTGQIGKRYARSDEIGIPLVITYDYDSLEDDTVTLRERNSMKQVRIPIQDVGTIIREFMLDIVSWDEMTKEFGEFIKNSK
ncbi:MAG: glycine--tRNA ligase [Candidatus Heimdallarchaeota archaeon]|nr:glycine--tRNA ligase [Candidatus Heimdallarchaeota archaeon]